MERTLGAALRASVEPGHAATVAEPGPAASGATATVGSGPADVAVDDRFDDVPSFSTGASFLDAAQQAHHKPLSAFGDLTDNARDAEATNLWIDVQEDEYLTVCMTDNGCGMNELRVRTGIGGIAHSDKGHRAEVHYGMGAKSAMPRLSPSSLVFSKDGTTRTVALISTTLSRKIGLTELKVPVASWPASGESLLEETSETAPLTREQRHSSLELILEHTPFATPAELLHEFELIPATTGACSSPPRTRLVLFECDPSQWQLERTDLRVVATDELSAPRPPHDASLRTYLEVLYYCDDNVSPPLEIHLCTEPVRPRNWTTFLHHWPSGQAHYSYTPDSVRLERASNPSSKVYGASVAFGTSEPLEDIWRVFAAKGSKPEVAERKRILEQLSGVFYYNHDRLIMPCERLKRQTEGHSGNKMLTTEKRLKDFGSAMIGVCREGFLVPEHNKAGYEAKAYEPSVFARPHRKGFADLHARVNEHLKEHLKTVISPIIARIYKREKAEREKSKRAADDDDMMLMDPAAIEHAADRSVRQPDRYQPSGFGAARKGVKRRQRPSAAAADDFEEGGRYRLVSDPRVAGSAHKGVGSGWYYLKLADGRSTGNVRLHEMRAVGFERSQLPAEYEDLPYELAHEALDGSLALVTFERSERGPNVYLPEPCILRRDATAVGAMQACYFDKAASDERLYVAIRPRDAACIAFDANGVELHLGGTLADQGFLIDNASRERAAAFLRGCHSLTSGVSVNGSFVRAPSRDVAGSSGGTYAYHADATPARVKGGDHPPSESVRDFLEHARLMQYCDALEEQGWDDLSHLRLMSDEDLRHMAETVAMKNGHLMRFKSYLGSHCTPEPID